VNSRLFWDASALVKAYVDETGSPNTEGALALEGVRGFVTEFVALEVVTVIGRKRREGKIKPPRFRSTLAEFYQDYPAAFDLLDVEEAVRRDALRLAEKHHEKPAGALDLLHLACARRAAAITRPWPMVFVSCDQPLLSLAQAEGLATYNPETQPHGALRSALRLPGARN
jgi:predicted nucleic acid-binding protein